MKDSKIPLTINDKTYNLYFNLNVMEAIQEEYGSVQKWGELTDGKSGEVNAKALIFGLTEMINEGIDIQNELAGTDEPFLTRKQVARIISQVGLQQSAEKLNEAIVESTKSDEKNV